MSTIKKTRTQTIDPSQTVEAPAWSQVLASNLLSKFPDTAADTRETIATYIEQLGLALESGDTCLKQSTADESERSVEWLCHPLVAQGEQALINPAPLVVEQAGAQSRYVYFYRHWHQEWQLAERLAALLNPDTAPAAVPVDLSAETSLKDLQRQAIELAATHPFTLITGGPGTGKTYTLARIVKALQYAAPTLRVALAAPTGKAAQRMQSVLSDEFSRAGVSGAQIQTAQTIHRLLGLGGRSTPRYHRSEPLPFDLIVIDEGSMLDLALASLLFDAIALGTRVIILGDANQLAAVDAGAVLADLDAVPALAPYRVALQESNRFKTDEGIGLLAAGVLNQQEDAVLKALTQSAQVQYFDLAKTPHSAVFHHLWQGFQPYFEYLLKLKDATHPLSVDQVKALFSAFDQFRVLCAQRAGDLGAHAINRSIGEALQQALGHSLIKRDGWYSGRPAMMTRNDYGLRISNGDIGVCLVDETGREWVYFPDRKAPIAATRLPPEQIETAFALTIHKSQGSEFGLVAMVLDDSAEDMLTRELIYTAITRAKAGVQVWSKQALLLGAIHKKSNRISGLRNQIARKIVG